MIRYFNGIDRRTHIFLIDDISEVTHLRTILYSRLNTFHESLKKSRKFTIRFLASLMENDHRTHFGRNLYKIETKTNSMCPTKSSIKNNLKYFDTPPSEEWRIPLCKDLLSIRNGHMTCEGLSKDDINLMIDYVCTS